MADWNAAVYHRVSNPQLDWGLPVLARLPLDGSETVVDVGCGTGRLTERLIERLPHGRVVAVDQSGTMLATAREYLLPRYKHQVSFVRSDAAALPFVHLADAIFSTATFHWVLDHDRLFRSLFAALRSGGRLVAQCGGVYNLALVHERCQRLMAAPPFTPHFAGWRHPWEFADAATTERRLATAGFVEVEADVHPSPVRFTETAEYREFVEHVICRPHLAHLPDAGLREAFMSRLTAEAARDTPPFELDYWRLNMRARKP